MGSGARRGRGGESKVVVGVVGDEEVALSLVLVLLGIDAPAISSKRGVAVEVREASVAPDCALTRPKRSHCNATHRSNFRASLEKKSPAASVVPGDGLESSRADR